MLGLPPSLHALLVLLARSTPIWHCIGVVDARLGILAEEHGRNGKDFHILSLATSG